ncbi:MAG: sulfatase family protein [Armatimonadota bacterium]
MRISRREFLLTGAATVGALATKSSLGFGAPAFHRKSKPNFLYLMCDQMCLDAMSSVGNAYVKTPNLDRLAKRGVLFNESYSTYPVCSPARSSLVTGRMPVETGVVANNLSIRHDIPNIGELLHEQAGYDAVYCGKWHIPEYYAPSNLRGFRTLPAGGGEGHADDCWVSQTCEAWLRNRATSTNASAPFLLLASFMNPHDICYWAISPRTLVPDKLPFQHIINELPPLPPNHDSRPMSPSTYGSFYGEFKTDLQWRYYLYCYYRMVEELDYNVGRLLTALEDSGYAENTVVVFTSDHGENGGCHGMVQKDRQYDSSMKVPLIWSCPGQINENRSDAAHLVSGIDIVSTICYYAGVKSPPGMGRSLHRLLEGRQTEWRDYLVSEWQKDGRIVRTPQYKYVMFKGDPVEQLFDMRHDPWETTNLAETGKCGSVIQDHQKLLREWNVKMDVLQPV